MKNCTVLFLVLLTGLLSCNKQPPVTFCQVPYSIDSSGAKYPLLEQWNFIGFVDTITDSISPPICGNYLSNILFTDTAPNTLPVPLTAPYNAYPDVYEGSSLINYYYGTYNVIDSAHIQFSQTLDTKINGVPAINAFETRFHTTLQQVNVYHIKYNILTLYPDTGSTVMRFFANI